MKKMIPVTLILFLCLLLCTACRSESKPKETRFSFVSEDSLTIVNAEGQELHFADKVWSGTMPVLDGHFTVDFVPGSTSVQVRFSESFSVRFEPERAKDRSICLSFDGDDFRAVEGPGLQNVEYTRSTVEATGERTYLEVTGSGESRVRYERDGKKGYFTAQDAPFTVVLRDRDQQEPLDTMDFSAGETCTIRIRDGVPSFVR